MKQVMHTIVRAAAALSLLLGTLSSGPVTAQGDKGPVTLSVNIKGLKGTEGQAIVTLHKREASWMKVPKAEQVVKKKISGKALKVDFRGLEPGVYAVLVIHDTDKNNELTMRWLPFPKPKEGVAASNDPKFKRAPEWKDAKIEVTQDQTIDVTVRYP